MRDAATSAAITLFSAAMIIAAVSPPRRPVLREEGASRRGQAPRHRARRLSTVHGDGRSGRLRAASEDERPVHQVGIQGREIG